MNPALSALEHPIIHCSCEWKQLFPASGNGVFIKPFITASVYGFWVNLKPCAFISYRVTSLPL